MRAKKITSKKLIGDFVTLKQALQSLPVSERTIRNYIDAGKLRAYKLDGMLVFNVLDIEAFLQRRKVGGGATAPVLKLFSAPDRVLSDDQAKEFFNKLPSWPTVADPDFLENMQPVDIKDPRFNFGRKVRN
jgi:hypothetical protein